MYDIHSENYENEDGSINKHLSACLDKFNKNIDS